MAAREEMPVELTARPFSVKRALELGVPCGRLRSGDLAAPFSGTRVPAGLEFDLRIRCRALATQFDSRHAFAGPTAALLWGMPLPRRLEIAGALHVSTPLGVRGMRRAGVVTSERSVSSTVGIRDGLPLIDVAHCWVQLGRFLSVHDLVAAADFLVTGHRGRDPLVSVAELQGVVDAARGVRGISALRAALTEVRVGAWSRPETLFRLVVVRAGVPEPELNHLLTLADGGRVRPDFLWREFAVAAEYDSGFRSDPKQWRDDISRTERVIDSGISLLHVTSADLYVRPRDLVRRVAQRLHAGGWRPLVPIDMTRSVRFDP